MDSYQDTYKSICRVCLNFGNSKNMVSLIDNKTRNGVSYYGVAVQHFANITINKNDSLPSVMCINCLSLLKQAIRFKLTCESSGKSLSEMVKIIGNDDEKIRKSVIEYSMFKFYFPQELNNKHTIVKTDKGKQNVTNSEKDNNASSEVVNDEIDLGECDTQSAGDKESQSGDKESHSRDRESSEDKESQSGHSETRDRDKQSQSEEKEPQSEDKQSQSGDKVSQDLNKKSLRSDPILKKLEQLIRQTSFNNTSKVSKMYKRKHIQLKRQYIMRLKMLRIKQAREEKKNRKFVCNICNKVLANQNTYEHHLQRHNGCRFICEHCGKGFPVKNELSIHQVALHGTGPYIQCAHCPFKAPRRFELMEHERLHTGERPYTCDKCGLTFRRRGIWKKHLIYHMEKKIQCPQCPKKFYQRGEMLAHANNVHDRVYVYVCDKCGATYAKSTTVRRHLTERHGIPREMQGKIIRVNKGSVSGSQEQ